MSKVMSLTDETTIRDIRDGLTIAIATARERRVYLAHVAGEASAHPNDTPLDREDWGGVCTLALEERSELGAAVREMEAASEAFEAALTLLAACETY